MEEISSWGGGGWGVGVGWGVHTRHTRWEPSYQHGVYDTEYPQPNTHSQTIGLNSLSKLPSNWYTKHGSLDTDSFVRALLQHRNTPLQEIGHSPAELLYGRPLFDHLPHHVDMANFRPEWLAVASERELALAKRNICNATAFNERHRT